MPSDQPPLTSDHKTARYRAFLSYSHRDRHVVAWLHRKLEHYHVPKKLVGTETPIGPVPHRLTPIFRDREELSASADLGTLLQAALSSSAFLVVICSPASAKSQWVDQEVLTYKRMFGEMRVLALIVGGEPYGSLKPGMEDQECFPRSLRYKVIDGELSTQEAEPIAADLRSHADGKRLALLKLIAGLTGVSLDAIVQRETQRRMRRLAMLSTASMAGMVAMGGLAFYANARRVEANEQRELAERESAKARAASDFLVGTFSLINPATENSRTVTAETILSRGAERARTELASQPGVQARIVETLAHAYNNLGLYPEAKTAVEKSWPAVRRSGVEGAAARQTLAFSYLQMGDLDKAAAVLAEARRVVGPDATTNVVLHARANVMEGVIDVAAGKTALGIAAFRRALAQYRSVPGVDQGRIVETLQNLGIVLSDDQQFDEANKTLTEALELNRRLLGDKHVTTGRIWSSLAQNAFFAGKLDVASSDIAKALEIERHVLDPDSSVLADTLSMQGQIFQGQGKLAEAQRSLDQAVEIYRKAFKKPHYMIGIAEVYLALVESDRGNVEGALATLDDAKHNYDVSYGKLHPNHGDLLVNRATILAKAKRMPEARQDCAAGLDILARTLGKDANYTKTMTQTCKKIGAL